MTTYSRFSRLNIDTAMLGVDRRNNEDGGYFCTPKGARIIGWAGSDGIHYCFVRGFGEMVFAASPMAPEVYVRPLARNFADFLGLLLACVEATTLEHAHYWDQMQFDAFLRDNPPLPEQQALLDIIKEKLSIAPMEQPLDYIKRLQSEFDYSGIRYAKAYYDVLFPVERKLPAWRVYFDGSFWESHSRGRAGKEILVNKQFTWGGEQWHIPAIYACSRGLVVDFCVQVSALRISAFREKWSHLTENAGARNLTAEQRMQIEAENPLSIDVTPQAILNGIALVSSHECGSCWNPCQPQNNTLEDKGVIDHYGLDPASGWVIRRTAFPWATKRKPKIETLRVMLKPNLVAIPGPHFRVAAVGDCIEFRHPITGKAHLLTVQEYEQQEVSLGHFRDSSQDYPTHCTALSYALSPDLPRDAFTVSDCGESDRPRRKQSDAHEQQGDRRPPQTSSSRAVIGIIGGSGPLTIFVANEPGELRATFSAIRFAPADVEWRMTFHEKTREDIVDLLKT